MNKVYLVVEYNYDETHIHAAYSNREAAVDHQVAAGKYKVTDQFNRRQVYEHFYYDIRELDLLDKYGESVLQ